MGFQNVPQVLKVFPNMFSIALHFVPYALPNGVLLQPTYSGWILGIIFSFASIFGSLQDLRAFFWQANLKGSLQTSGVSHYGLSIYIKKVS
jgi:hypothetical protein